MQDIEWQFSVLCVKKLTLILGTRPIIGNRAQKIQVGWDKLLPSVLVYITPHIAIQVLSLFLGKQRQLLL